jgi:hypothetical protein
MDFGWLSAAGAVAMFAWLAVDSWVNARKKEREAFYRSETIRRINESAGSADSAINFIREEERITTLKMREGLKLMGLIITAGGIGLGSFLFMIELTQPVWSLAFVPVLVGIAMLTYIYVLAPKQ